MEGDMPDGSMNFDPEEATSSAETAVKGTRQKSAIEFPYVDLDDGISVARALLRMGAVPCDRDQLAAEMKQSLSGSFVNKTSAAKMFGLVEFASGKYQLTQLGHAILDSNDSTRVAVSKAEAFLKVPLFRRIYDDFRNNQLPPSPHGLEQSMVSFGVPEKQKDKARRAFESSARQAGFFARGNDRLVAPVIAPNQTPAAASGQSERKEPATPGSSKVTLPVPAEHPFIKGLLLSLPEKLGEEWSVADRTKWLQTAADAFELMFRGGGPIMIAPATAPRSRASRKPRNDETEQT
jgi:hypothetical protein